MSWRRACCVVPGSVVVAACECPVDAAKGGGCPMEGGKYVAPMQYDVYGRAIDPRNKMPPPNQEPSPGQAMPLSTSRVASTIPKGGTQETWTYPSPQMFWNSLVRKGKADGATEADMDAVVAVHNNMNELTWRKILEWEQLREGPHEPRLSRFTGRPSELSVEARLKRCFGHPPPFDRHDWIVDRGGAERRYVIDYYSDESQADTDQVPKLHDVSAVKSILVDVRPALDSVDAAIDRFLRMPRLRAQGLASPPLPFFATTQMRAASTPDDDDDVVAAKINAACAKRFAALRDCGDDGKKCADAAIALQHCVATVVCPEEAAAFQRAAISDDKDQAEQAYAAMDAALARYAAAHQPN
ncbi:hypothetical protein CTAYLR_008243 [Chrysophaeum taylorii]|uniref:Holocytochrome c-type synthase n=1 Tax=Chrysophaeum taylorii TaxID=2483200 RepID=A0AAD7XKY1_9STRA|nr:hypothetical protein CTAYLR_008243 [Chrysophaeum taylorii]